MSVAYLSVCNLVYLYLDIFVSKCFLSLYLCIFACLYFCIFVCLDIWMFRCLDVCMLGCLYVGMFVGL